MRDLIFVKLGGSVITDKTKPYTARMSVIKRLAKEIYEARKKKRMKLIVGHGGGSFPHTTASKYRTQYGIINEQSIRGIAVVQNDAAKLNRIIVNALLRTGENAISIQPSVAAIAKNGKIVSWDIKPIKKMLSYGLIPLPYGDIGIDTKKGCCILSTEEIFNFLAKRLRPRKIIMVTNVDGVYDDRGRLISRISNSNYKKIRKFLGGSGKTLDVTGGMAHKVEKMLKLAKLGIKTLIINGNRPRGLYSVLLGEKVKGTEIC